MYATLGRKLGVARDVTSVASAVLEACREIFPETSTGMVLINDPADGLLKSPGVFLSSSGVGPGGPAYELAPGEGLGGAAFVAERAELWPTTLSASMAQASLREANRVRLRRSKLGLHPVGDRRATAGGRRHDRRYPADLGAPRERLGRGGRRRSSKRSPTRRLERLERARRHEEEMGRALLDAVTGLATRRQLLAVIDKELARASRQRGDAGADHGRHRRLRRAQRPAGATRPATGCSRAFAEVLRSILRREDSAARSGADEFVCVLPGADRDQARAVAARIQQRFAAETAGDQSHRADRGPRHRPGSRSTRPTRRTWTALLAVASNELDGAKSRTN